MESCSCSWQAASEAGPRKEEDEGSGAQHREAFQAEHPMLTWAARRRLRSPRTEVVEAVSVHAWPAAQIGRGGDVDGRRRRGSGTVAALRLAGGAVGWRRRGLGLAAALRLAGGAVGGRARRG
uniref:Uncharacterized protein n=1 Tax=Oryza sativa subsp. japonica TaxID=39947 RepID=Q6K971_ORYSJ|nr:hypothetical protein [Oryza sativa Japonica Group]